MLKLKSYNIFVLNNYSFLYLASGVLNDEGFWLVGIKSSETKILDDKNLLECHRKELIGDEPAKDILNAINLTLGNLTNELQKQNFIMDTPPKGISFNIPLIVLENIFDFWVEKYKVKEEWETCLGLLKIRKRVSLKNLINSDSIKGNSKKWAIELERLHKYKPSSIKKNELNDPMWQ